MNYPIIYFCVCSTEKKSICYILLYCFSVMIIQGIFRIIIKSTLTLLYVYAIPVICETHLNISLLYKTKRLLLSLKYFLKKFCA